MSDFGCSISDLKDGKIIYQIKSKIAFRSKGKLNRKQIRNRKSEFRNTNNGYIKIYNSR